MSWHVPLSARLTLPVPPKADQGVVLVRDVDVVTVRKYLLSEGAVIPDIGELHRHNDIDILCIIMYDSD